MLTETTKKVNRSNGYYTEAIRNKFTTSYLSACKAIRNNEPGALSVTISHGNSKMGEVASVSLLPFNTYPGRCKDTCGVKCYAAKIANVYTSVRESYARNTAIATLRLDVFWSAVDSACKAVRFFRFHVSGDIPAAGYFAKMIDTARNNSHCEILVFTKSYEVVNTWIASNGSDALPGNLHILFSGWSNLKPINPYNLPETNVFKAEQDIKPDWKICGGNCFNCACRGVGCWQAGRGDTIAFKMH